MRSLAMTPARRAQFAKAAAAKFDVGESLLQPVVEKAIRQLLVKMRARLNAHVAAAHLTAAAAAPDPKHPSKPGTPQSGSAAPGFGEADVEKWLTAMDAAPDWGDILDTTVMPTYSSMLDDVLKPAMQGGNLLTKTLTDWRNKWLSDRRQVLVSVPDTVTSQFRTALQDVATKNGTSVDDARDVAQSMLDEGYPSWSGRAQTIARTETVGANNQGALASWSALSDANGVTATKTWLSTPDSRTRESHASMDGQTVDISAMFDVNGSQMNGPGDPNGDAGEVINCRCTMTYDFPDGTEQTADDAGDGEDAEAGDDASGEGDGSAVDDAGGLSDFPTVDSGLTAANVVPAEQTGVAVMLGVGAGTEASILSTDGVPDVEAPGLHCTMAYLSEPAASYTPEQQQALISALAPLIPQIVANSFATAQFNPNDPEREPCAVLLVQSDALAQLHDQVSEAVVAAGLQVSTTFPIWIPHIAIGYNISSDVIPPTAVGVEIDFNRLVLGWGGQQIVVAGDGAEPVDPAGQTEPEPSVTAAVEADVTAPAVAPSSTPPPAAPATGPDTATGGDTPSPLSPDLTPGAFTWSGPLAMLGTPSSDGRQITSGGGTIRPLPLPLSWQESSDIEHDGSVIVGRILSVEDQGGVLWGTGDWLDPMMVYQVTQAMALVDAGLGLISIDMGATSVELLDPTGAAIDPALYNGMGEDLIANYLTWEFCGATLVSVPAFADARIVNDPPTVAENAADLVGEPIMIGDTTFAAATPEAPTISTDGTSITLVDGTSVAVGDQISYPAEGGSSAVGTISAIDSAQATVSVTPAPADDGTSAPDITVPIANLAPAGPAPATKPDDGSDASLTASSEIRPYTRANFNERKLAGPTPLTVDPETGAVFGHLGTWGECHVGKLEEMGICQTVPHSETGYADFHLTPVLTDAGPLDVGRITVGTGHARPGGGFRGAVQHYDNSGSQVAIVRAYEDEFGVQLAGQIIHDTPGPKIEEMMRSPLSGDWRMRNGNLELCAALAVNVPGFPVRRPTPVTGFSPKMGQMSLVAAGVVEPRRAGTKTIVMPSGAVLDLSDMESIVAAVRSIDAPKPHASGLTQEQRQRALRLKLSMGRGRVGV